MTFPWSCTCIDISRLFLRGNGKGIKKKIEFRTDKRSLIYFSSWEVTLDYSTLDPFFDRIALLEEESSKKKVFFWKREKSSAVVIFRRNRLIQFRWNWTIWSFLQRISLKYDEMKYKSNTGEEKNIFMSQKMSSVCDHVLKFTYRDEICFLFFFFTSLLFFCFT